jgi:hypothetical protein
MKTQLKISDSKKLIKILSEPYVIFSRLGYQPAIDVEDVHKGEIFYLIISAVSLGEPLHEISKENEGKLSGLCISLQKESASRMSRYIVSNAEF